MKTREMAPHVAHKIARPRRLGGKPVDRPGLQAVAALGIYLLVSLFFFGIPVLSDFRHSYVGLGRRELGTGFTDPSVFIWALRWWPYALSHGIDPLFTRLLWAPEGVNLAWTTSIPGASILAWPITATLGPVAAFNVWMLLSPVLAAWTAFLLCRHVTRTFWPSLIGGYLFGFSSYMLAQMTAHLNLALVFPIPIAVLLVLLRVEGRLRTLLFVLLLGVTLALQYSFSIEVAFTLTLFGFMAAVLALAFFPEARPRLIRIAGWVSLSYAAAAVLLAPLVLALKNGSGLVPVTWHTKYATDLLNLFVPTRIALLRPPGAERIADRFSAGLSEDGAYLGLVILVVVLFAIRFWRTPGGRFLLASLGLVLMASLGPGLRVLGIERAPLPWTLTAGIPLLRMALPARMMLYAWLLLALLTAMWLAAPDRQAWGRWAKWGVAGLCVVSLLPNLTLPLWHARTDTPAFFATDLHRRTLEPGRNTLVIPFASNGFSMLWQAESDLSFPMVGGYIACGLPRDYRRWAIVASFLSKRRILRYDVQFRAFLGHFDVANIVVQPGAPGPWGRMLRTIPVRAAHVGGVLYYRVPDRLLSEYRQIPRPLNITWKALQRACQ